MSQQQEGCRAGRKPPIEDRLAARDRARHDLRTEQMRDVKNWPTRGK